MVTGVECEKFVSGPEAMAPVSDSSRSSNGLISLESHVDCVALSNTGPDLNTMPGLQEAARRIGVPAAAMPPAPVMAQAVAVRTVWSIATSYGEGITTREASVSLSFIWSYSTTRAISPLCTVLIAILLARHIARVVEVR